MSNFNDAFKLNCLTLNVTNNCNLNCSYCFEKNKGNDYMSIENAIGIFEKSYKNFKNNFDMGIFTVAFFGGEPMLNFKVIKAVIEYSKDKGYSDISFGITTNLTILNDDMIEYIEDNDIHLIVSIDGIKRIHDANRCNSYDIVEKNIKKMIEAGAVRLIEARMTIAPDCIETMYDGVVNIINLGVDNIDPMFVVDMKWSQEQFKELLNQTEKLINLVIDISNDETNKRNISIKTIEEKLVYCYSYNNKHSIPCTFGSNSFISIDYKGDIMPCHQRHYTNNNDKLYLGNIFTDTILKENLLGKIQPHSWHSEVNSLDCAECTAKSLCRGWCPSENYDLRNDMLEVPAIMCFYYIALSEMIPVYQDRIMNAKNLRSHTLNMLKYSLILLKELDDLKEIDITSDEFIPRLIDFNSKLIIEKEMILPAFVSAIYEDIEDLKNALLNYYNDEGEENGNS